MVSQITFPACVSTNTSFSPPKMINIVQRTIIVEKIILTFWLKGFNFNATNASLLALLNWLFKKYAWLELLQTLAS